MPWIRIDDHFDEHPKLAAVGPVGWGVWLAGLAYCNRNLTDGFIPYAIAEGIGGAWLVREPIEDDAELDNEARTVMYRERIWSIDIGSGIHGEHITTQWVVAQLVRVRLWERVDGGYQIHDYPKYQPSKSAVLKERKRIRSVRSDAGKKGAAATHGKPGGKASGKASGKPLANDVANPQQSNGQNPVPVPNPKPNPVERDSLGRTTPEGVTDRAHANGPVRP
jgi:hypothetical protein